MLGSGLLVKPVTAPGTTHLDVQLPAGARWYDAVTGAAVQPAKGRTHRVQVGGRAGTAQAGGYAKRVGSGSSRPCAPAASSCHTRAALPSLPAPCPSALHLGRARVSARRRNCRPRDYTAIRRLPAQPLSHRSRTKLPSCPGDAVEQPLPPRPTPTPRRLPWTASPPSTVGEPSCRAASAPAAPPQRRWGRQPASHGLSWPHMLIACLLGTPHGQAAHAAVAGLLERGRAPSGTLRQQDMCTPRVRMLLISLLES